MRKLAQEGSVMALVPLCLCWMQRLVRVPEVLSMNTALQRSYPQTTVQIQSSPKLRRSSGRSCRAGVLVCAFLRYGGCMLPVHCPSRSVLYTGIVITSPRDVECFQVVIVSP